MKCPDCFSENYELSESDHVIMSCKDCHATYSLGWSLGFWVGFLKAEKKYKRYHTNTIERLEGEKTFNYTKGMQSILDRAISIVKEMGGE